MSGNEKSLYCSACKINWPPERDQYLYCPDCGQHTFWSTTTEPDQASLIIHEAAGTQKTDAHGWRVERYLELGFSVVDSQLLALAKWEEVDSLGRTWTLPLNWHRVEAALADGCPPALARRIFS